MVAVMVQNDVAQLKKWLLASQVPDNGGIYFVPALTGFKASSLGPICLGLSHRSH
jgi:glycerol kinase